MRKIGPLLETAILRFQIRTNVEFIRVLNDAEIEVRFWERGVGHSNASGTGSCGATVAIHLDRKNRQESHGACQRQAIFVVEWLQKMAG